MERKFKGLTAINDVLDDRYKKLSDKYHELKLSHNRKKKALEKLRAYYVHYLDYINNAPITAVVFQTSRIVALMETQTFLKICDDALFSDGRVNTRIKKNG